MPNTIKKKLWTNFFQYLIVNKFWCILSVSYKNQKLPAARDLHTWWEVTNNSTNNSIANLLSFSLLPLLHSTRITMGCFPNTAYGLSQSLIGFSTASFPNTGYSASPARFGEHNNTFHVTANYMKFRTYLELLSTTKWWGGGCLVEFLPANRIWNYCDIIQNYGLSGCDLVQYWTPTFRMQLLSAVSRFEDTKDGYSSYFWLVGIYPPRYKASYLI